MTYTLKNLWKKNGGNSMQLYTRKALQKLPHYRLNAESGITILQYSFCSYDFSFLNFRISSSRSALSLVLRPTL